MRTISEWRCLDNFQKYLWVFGIENIA